MNQPRGSSDLFTTIHQSPSMAHVNRTRHRSFSLNIFLMNAQELIEIAQQVHDPDEGLRLMSEANRHTTQSEGSPDVAPSELRGHYT